MDDAPTILRSLPALQQPDWDDAGRLPRVRAELATRSALVEGSDVRWLHSVLARVAAGEMHVLQAGDCAEDPAERTPAHVARKVGLIELLAGRMRMITGTPVVRVGRIAGQFGKPRSRPTEVVGGVELPAYRGHMVNGPEPDPVSRRADPRRLLRGYEAAGEVMMALGWLGASPRSSMCPPVWTSHEALLLDYERPMLRSDRGGRLLTSTHWPWVGERTGDPAGAHVELLAEVTNPVGYKVGPGRSVADLLAVCARLDPRAEPGRLTLIARMGADQVADRLPPLVEAVRAAGHPVIWLCDPMHGNTVAGPGGLKTRYVDTIVEEVRGFRAAVRAGGGVGGGLHLETTPDDVTECIGDPAEGAGLLTRYTSLCDPRLNPGQADAVVAGWA